MTADDQRIDEAAADWLFRREQGLDAAAQDVYLQWLRDDPRHGRAIARLERSWKALDALKEWRPRDSAVPNPDLLSQPCHGLPRSRRVLRLAVLTASLAAALVATWYAPGWFESAGDQASVRTAAKPQVIRHEPEQRLLPDGSRLTLQPGSQIEVAFSPAQRRIRLSGGEAHFEVAKNPDWPFFVETPAGLTVRAIGTAFNVRLAEAEVAVVVTEGKVLLETEAVAIPSPAPGSAAPANLAIVPATAVPVDAKVAARQSPPLLIAGQSAKFALPEQPAEERSLQVVSLTPEEVARATDWRVLRLEFRDLPLREVVAEFNRHNTHQLALGDDAVGKLTIGGTFRADNAAAFVRLLESLLGVRVQAGPNVTTIYSPTVPRP